MKLVERRHQQRPEPEVAALRAPSRRRASPRSRSCRKKATSTTPFCTAMPSSTMNATAAETDSGIRKATTATTPPTSANGRFSSTSSACAQRPERQVEEQDHEQRAPRAPRSRAAASPAAGSRTGRRTRRSSPGAAPPRSAPSRAAHVLDEAAEVAPADVRLDDDAPHAVLAADLRRRLDELDLRELRQRHPLARRAPAPAAARSRGCPGAPPPGSAPRRRSAAAPR